MLVKNGETAMMSHNDRDWSPKSSVAVGALLQLCITRPDLNYAVGQVAEYSSNPDKSHVNAVKRILAYVKGPANYGIRFGTSNGSVLQSYCDADYARDTDTRRSTTGYVLMLNGGPVAWGSRRQYSISLDITLCSPMSSGRHCVHTAHINNRTTEKYIN